MVDKLVTTGVTVLIAIIGVAVIALLVSKQSDTVGVLGAGTSGFAQALCAATSPLTGSSCGGRALIPSVDSNITFGGTTPTFGSQPFNPIPR